MIDRRVIRSLNEREGMAALDNYGDHFHCCFVSVPLSESRREGVPQIESTIRLDLVVGTNWLLTVGDEGFDLFEAFRERDHAETLIGKLSSGTLAASLLDVHLSRYIAALEALESWLDGLDVKLLASRTADEDLLKDLVEARRYVSRLRRSLAPQRNVFYGMARPDFLVVADTAASEAFRSLERRFDRVVDAVEHGRELVQGSFELFTTRISESTNSLIRRLTFISLILGAIGATAEILRHEFRDALYGRRRTRILAPYGCACVRVDRRLLVSKPGVESNCNSGERHRPRKVDGEPRMAGPLNRETTETPKGVPRPSA